MSFSFLKLEENKFALSVHPPRGTSVYSSKIIERDNHRAEITESEMENAISQAIWKLFDEERMLFSKRLDVSEMDVVMADVRVLYIKIDGGSVVNPIGFPAKRIEIGLAEILITRDMSEDVKSSVPKNGEIVFTLEPTASCAWLIQKDAKHKDFAVAKISDDRTFVYHSSGGEKISYVSDFPWGVNDIINSVSENFSVAPETAREIIRKYAKENMSAEMMKSLKNAVSLPFAGFSKGVTLAVRNVKIKRPALYVINSDLSELDPKRISWRESGIKTNFLPSIGYEEIASHEMSSGNMASPWNRIARRRMKWLMCHK